MWETREELLAADFTALAIAGIREWARGWKISLLLSFSV